MKKFASLLLTVVMLATMLSVFAVPASADDAPTSGQCGDKLKWSINADHTVLTFTGSGDMRDYEYWRMYGDIVPWWDYRDTVTIINFPKEISHISNYAFCYFSKIERVWIPSDTVSMGKQCFFGCENLVHMAIGTADGKISDNIKIGSECFEQCKKLRYVYISRALKTVEWDAFEQCYMLYCIDKQTGGIYPGDIYYGGTEQEYKDNVTVDMGDDNGNEYFIAANHYYRNNLWDASKWRYNDTECWHGLFIPNNWYGVKPFDLGRSDLTPLDKYENNGMTYWHPLPDGTRINEKAINWEYDEKGYSATLPDGTVLSGAFKWQSDGYKHWYALPNGQRVKTEAHTLQDGVCTVCGGSENSTVGYIDKNGKTVISSGEPKKINSDTRTLSGGEYVVIGKVTIPKAVRSIGYTQFHEGKIASNRLEVTEDSTIILKDGCEFNCEEGIHVRPGKTLTICSESLNQETMGRLTATAPATGYAGIGSNNKEGLVHIVICGGKVTAGNSESWGAGIGTGSDFPRHSVVDIYNGIVEGIGSGWAAGIGCSKNSSCYVNIYNGTVKAQGGEGAADIGAGESGDAEVYISKAATVTAERISNRQDSPLGATFGFPNGEPVPGTNRPFEDGDYKIYSALDDKMCVDIDGSKGATNATDNVHLWSDSTAAYNVFTLTWDANAEAYSIKVKHSGLMLDVAGGSKGNGANIQQWGDNGTDAQRWVFEPAGNGYYYIRCKGGQYMDAAGLPNGTQPFDDVNIQSWSFIGASGQKFKPVKVEASNNPPVIGSVLSQGSIWIILAAAVVAVAGVATLVIIKKKKKPALADGTESKDEE